MLGASGFVAASVGHEMLFPGVSNAQIVPDPFCGVESVPAWAYAVKWDETLLSVQVIFLCALLLRSMRRNNHSVASPEMRYPPSRRSVSACGHPLSVQGHKLWVRSIGDAPKRGLFNLTKKTDPVGQTPVLCVHSGPGFSSRYMETIEFLGSYRRVIFYDMSGCGNSSAANGGYTPGIRSLGGYVDELQAVVERLGLEKVHLLGHGFGGMLALEAVAQVRE